MSEDAKPQPKIQMLPPGIQTQIVISIDDNGKAAVNFAGQAGFKPSTVEVARILLQTADSLLGAAIQRGRQASKEADGPGIVIPNQEVADKILKGK